MSYRAFKRLLGETSLERKCRFLFGTAIFVLITLSFWLYAHLTEDLAYGQAVNSCRLVVSPSLGHYHLEKNLKTALAAESAQVKAAYQMVDPRKDYQYNIIVENAKTNDTFERDLFRDFRNRGAHREYPLDHQRADAGLFVPDPRGRIVCGVPLSSWQGRKGLARHHADPHADQGDRGRRPLEPGHPDDHRPGDGPAHHGRQLPHRPLRHRQAGQAPEGGQRRHLRRRAERPQRDPDRRRVRGPQPRLQPHAPQPGQHAGPVAQGERRPRPQGGRAGPGQPGPVRIEPPQERLPGHHEPRAAHAAQQHPRLQRGAAVQRQP